MFVFLLTLAQIINKTQSLPTFPFLPASGFCGFIHFTPRSPPLFTPIYHHACCSPRVLCSCPSVLLGAQHPAPFFSRRRCATSSLALFLTGVACATRRRKTQAPAVPLSTGCCMALPRPNIRARVHPARSCFVTFK